MGLGILAVQEMQTVGVERWDCLDQRGGTWALCTGGPSSRPKVQGTGFLASPSFEVLLFEPLSPRVSWIAVRQHPEEAVGLQVDVVACFVTGYAPTET